MAGLYHASDADRLTLVFDAAPPEFERTDVDFPEWERLHRDAYRQNAALLVDALEHHAPGALMDALLAELCTRKASILRVLVTRKRR